MTTVKYRTTLCKKFIKYLVPGASINMNKPSLTIISFKLQTCKKRQINSFSYLLPRSCLKIFTYSSSYIFFSEKPYTKKKKTQTKKDEKELL